MNEILIIGNLTRDPELTETSTGKSVCHFSVAVNRDYSDKEGNQITDFFPVTVWGPQAESSGKYLKKGSQVAVKGSLETRTYEKDGTQRFAIDVRATKVQFLSRVLTDVQSQQKTSETSKNGVKNDTRQEVKNESYQPAYIPPSDNQLPF